MSSLALLPRPTHKAEDWRYTPEAVLAEVWPVAVEEITVRAGASDSHAIIAEAGAEPQARQIALVLEDDSSFDLRLLNLAGGYSRIAIDATLGARAQLTIGGVQLAGGDDVLEIVTAITHAAPDATSRQLIRSVAGGGASVTYLGKVRVERGADGTDGAQSVRAMLLSPQARANAKPELEIYADDVKCAHGCAVGELDANALFYMAARGVPPEAARALMLQAFVAEALTGAPDEERLTALVAARLGDML